MLNIPLKIKIVTAFLIVASLVGIIGYMSSATLSSVKRSFSDTVISNTIRLRSLEKIRYVVSEIKNETLSYQRTTNETVAEVQKNRFLANLEKTLRWEEEYADIVRLEKGATRTELETQAKEIVGVKDKVVNLSLNLVALKEQRANAGSLQQAENELRVAQDQLSSTIDGVIEKEQTKADRESLAVDEQVNRLSVISTVSSIVAVVFALALGVGLSMLIGRNLRKLKEGADHIANADFSHRIVLSSQDEFGKLATAFNEMSGRLKESYRRIALESKRDEAMLQSLGEGIIALDEAGNVVLLNEHAVELLDLVSREETSGKELAALVTLYDQSGQKITKSASPIGQALKKGKSADDVFMIQNDVGKRLVNITANPVVLYDKVVGVVIAIRDVTKEREVDRMKTEFISLASHQLRTPLSAINWFGEMLLEDELGQEQREFAQNIVDSSKRMTELVNSLLNISRIESGRIIVDPRPTDLHELVSGIINDLQAKIQEKGHTFVVSVHPDIPKINLDPRLISQVYMNLLTNAIKYTPSGGEVSVFVSAKGDQVISQISDNGYGIPKSQHAKLFQKFFRAENIVKIETDGNGLGMYLVKAIIESSGGKIWFESEEGKGSTFWFSLPLSGMKAKEGEVTLD